MTFVAAFYNFSITLSDSDRGIFETFRVKTPRHELESREHLYARMIAFCHSYRPGQEFSLGGPDSKEPTIVARDVVQTTLLWAEVGVPEKRKLELSLKQHPSAEHLVYFFEEDQKNTFCHLLRGSKTNWVAGVRFYQIPSDFIETLCSYENSSPQWNITFIDSRVYLQLDGHDLESQIIDIDIWDAYQESLRLSASSEHSPSGLQG